MKHGKGSVIVWGCMSAAGVGTLQFIDGIMNHWVHIDILKCNLSSSAEEMDIKLKIISFSCTITINFFVFLVNFANYTNK